MPRYLATFCSQLTLLVIASLSFSLNSYANTISGTVSLPNGIVAGSGGVEISLLASPIVDVFTSFENVIIPQGQSSVAYAFDFSENQNKEIQFTCQSGCNALDITTEGSWDNSRGVVGNLDGEIFSGTQNHTVNIKLERADTFSGKVIFPENFTITGDEFILVYARSANQFAFFDRFSYSDFLEKDATEFAFSIGVPTKSIQNFGWTVEVICLDCSSPIGESDFFSTKINGGVMSLNQSSAFTYTPNRDYKNMNLSYPFVLEAPATFKLSPIFLLLDD